MPLNPHVLGPCAMHTPTEQPTPANLRDVQADEELRNRDGHLIPRRSEQIRVMRHMLRQTEEI